MLRITSELMGYPIESGKERIGTCKDFLFDDEYWTIRYMVADAGSWLSERKVLVHPMSLDRPDWKKRIFPVNITREQIEKAPPLEENAPVSRQHEQKLLAHYGHPYYWVGSGVWGPEPTPAALHARGTAAVTVDMPKATADSHMRSIDEVIGYHIKASDGEIGHVEDFVMDDETWTIRYMVVDTRNWLPGKKVLVSPEWIDGISWANREVRVGMKRESIKDSPEFDPGRPVNREYEVRLYDYYGKPQYWQNI